MATSLESRIMYTSSPGMKRHTAVEMTSISTPHASNSAARHNKTVFNQANPPLEMRKKSSLVDGVLPEISEPAHGNHPGDGYTRVRTESDSVEMNSVANEVPTRPKGRQKVPPVVQCGSALGPTRIPPYLRSAPVRRLRHPLEESPIWGAAGGALSGALSLAVALPALLLLFFLLPICLLARSMAFLVAVWGRRTATGNTDSWADRPEPVRGNDARWLGPTWRRSVLHAVLVFDSGLEVGALRQLVANRVLPRHPRLTSRLINLPPPAPPCWLHDPRFKIERHVFPAALKPSKRKVKGEGATPNRVTEKQLQKYVARLIAAGLPASKPPWEMRVIRGYGKHMDTVAVLRVHQCLADGMSLVRLLCHALADSRVLHVPQQPHFGGQSFSLNAVRACLAGPLTLLLWLLLLAAGGVKDRGGGWWSDCNPLTQRASWSGRITLCWSANIALPKVTRVKHVTRSTVNDVLMAALAGAVRSLLQGCGVRHPPNLRVVLPVDLRSDISSPKPTSRMGCKVAPVVVALPVAIEGAVPRLWAMRKSLETLKSSPEPVVVYGATAALMALLPQKWACRVLNIPPSTASLQFSALPGPPGTLLVGGHPLKGVFPILPAPEGLGLSISAFTYADQVYVTIAADSGLAAAAKVLLSHLQAQIELLWQLLLHRRLPGEMRPPLITRNSDLARPTVQELQARLYQIQMDLQHLSLQVIASSVQQREDQLECIGNRSVDQRVKTGGVFVEEIIEEGDIIVERTNGSVIVQVESDESADTKREEYALAMAQLRILKAEFMEILTELRKRRSLTQGPESLMFEDEELGGELWRPRSSSVSRRSISLAGFLSAATGRPSPSTSSCASPTSPLSTWVWESVPQESFKVTAQISHDRLTNSIKEEERNTKARGEVDKNHSDSVSVNGVNNNRDIEISDVQTEDQDMRLEEFRRTCSSEKEI